MPGLHVNVMLFYRRGLPNLRVQILQPISCGYMEDPCFFADQWLRQMLGQTYRMLWGQFVPTVMFPCLRAEKKGEEKGSDGRPLGSTHETEGQEKFSPAVSVKGGWRQ